MANSEKRKRWIKDYAGLVPDILMSPPDFANPPTTETETFEARTQKNRPLRRGKDSLHGRESATNTG